MDLTPKQQASEAIRQAQAILIVSGQRPNIDQVSSMVALGLILRKLGKKVTTLASDQIPASANFIAAGSIEKNLTGLRDFIIKVDLARAEVDKIKYDIGDGKLNIHVMPFKGGFSQSDVSFAHGDYHYDIVIVMGVPQRAKLDRIFEQYPTLLQDTPLVNIDYHRINENYGAINLIDSNAATLSEMLISLSESLETGLIDEPIATAMLTGIIASTDRFTAAHTTAKSMTVAAQLMAAGAKQQSIVKALYGDRTTSGNRDSRPPRQEQHAPRQDTGNRSQTPQQPAAPVAQATTALPPTPAPAPSPEPVVYQPQTPAPTTQMPVNPTPATAMPYPAENAQSQAPTQSPAPQI
jgi:nanoRNase/pAp phosphatase (c-di-AMP/oligoRNAs hydrolase)